MGGRARQTSGRSLVAEFPQQDRLASGKSDITKKRRVIFHRKWERWQFFSTVLVRPFSLRREKLVEVSDTKEKISK